MLSLQFLLFCPFPSQLSPPLFLLMFFRWWFSLFFAYIFRWRLLFWFFAVFISLVNISSLVFFIFFEIALFLSLRKEKTFLNASQIHNFFRKVKAPISLLLQKNLNWTMLSGSKKVWLKLKMFVIFNLANS